MTNWVWLMLWGCPALDDTAVVEPVDLTVTLGEDEARAGVITQSEVLIGGTAGEGRLGDVMLVNDRVRFVVQGLRESGYYIGRGGGVIDADIVRPAGAPGRDVLDDMTSMVGLGRGIEPTAVTVLADGVEGGAAVVEVTGTARALSLFTGALESEDIVPDVEMEATTTYTLEPGSSLLSVRTEVRWLDDATTLQVGDLLLVGMEQLERWYPGRGLEDDGDTPAWLGLVSTQDDLALALFPGGGEGYPESSIADLLSELGPVIGGVEASQTVEEGDTVVWERQLGVGPDLATLTDAWLGDAGAQSLGGTVEADGVGVAGVRVHVLDPDGLPYTLAITDADGAWSAQVPDDGAYSVVAEGRGSGYQTDLAPGAAAYPPFGHPVAQQAALASLVDGSDAVVSAAGFGVGEPVAASSDTTLTLEAPGWLDVAVDDGRPMVVRVAFASGDAVSGDSRWTRGRPGGDMAWAYAASGAVRIAVEPGDYSLTVHRGVRWEPWTGSVTVASGETAEVDAVLEEAWSLDGVFGLDPHSHGAASGDGDISMVHRVLVHAAHGLDVHVGSDHDGVTNYQPVADALGLEGFSSVVADEVSPVLRGHFNAYPVEVDTGGPRGGAPAWWQWIPETTDELWQEVRTWTGPDAVLQANHPTDTQGLFEASRLSASGQSVGNPYFWSDGFDAVEVLNRDDWEENTETWLMLVNVGFRPVPVSASDSHGYRDGVGENVTFVNTGEAAFTDAGLVAAYDAVATVATRGPMVHATIDGVWAPGQTVTGTATLEVEVLAPSWVLPDTLTLFENGEVVATETIEGDSSGLRHSTRFALEPAADASYVVLVQGDARMSPVYPGATPWALTAPVWVDVDGDGWEPPGGELDLGE